MNLLLDTFPDSATNQRHQLFRRRIRFVKYSLPKASSYLTIEDVAWTPIPVLDVWTLWFGCYVLGSAPCRSKESKDLDLCVRASEGKGSNHRRSDCKDLQERITDSVEGLTVATISRLTRPQELPTLSSSETPMGRSPILDRPHATLLKSLLAEGRALGREARNSDEGPLE